MGVRIPLVVWLVSVGWRVKNEGKDIGVTGENRVVRQLRGVAAKLTSDQELRKDLLQEMFIHLVRLERERSGHTASWKIRSCEFHARNYLKHGRSVDSHKRAADIVPLGLNRNDSDGQLFYFLEAVDPRDTVGEMLAKDIVEQVAAKLTDNQQQILFLLLKGWGVREIARKLGVSHPAVIKHRRKMAILASALLDEAQADLSGSSVG